MDQYTDIARDFMLASHRLKHVYKSHMDAAGNLKPSEIGLLIVLKEHGKEGAGLKISELSNLLHVTSPFVTQLVTGLEERGLVVRTMDKRDRRSVKAGLTEQGKATTIEAQENFMQVLRGVFEHLGAQKSRQFVATIDEIVAYLLDKENHKGDD